MLKPLGVNVIRRTSLARWYVYVQALWDVITVYVYTRFVGTMATVYVQVL